MTVELIVAPPAGGKTSTCIKRIQSLRKEMPLAEVQVIVAGRLQADLFRRRLADAGGALAVGVGSFTAFYQKILERSGRYLPLASSALQYRLVQEVVDLAVSQSDLAYFQPLQSMAGFITALRDSFAELKRAFIDARTFFDYTKNGTPAQHDLAVLYSMYQNRMRELNWADVEDLGWLAIEELEKQPSTCSSINLIIVDGFNSFNGVQFRILKLLSASVNEFIITFPGLPGYKRHAHRGFAENYNKLVHELSPTITILENEPYLTSELLHIERNLFEIDCDRTQKPVSPMLLEARSPVEEAREALRWIKKLVVRKNISLSNCMIFTPDPDLYHPFLRMYADEYGIPIRFTKEEYLINSPMIAALINLLTLPVKNYRTQELFKVLRSPYFDFSIDSKTIDEMETVCRTARIIEGRDQWQEIWEQLINSSLQEQDDIDDERNVPLLPRSSRAVELDKLMNGFFGAISPQDCQCTLTEWVSWLEDLLDRLLFFEKADSGIEQEACEVFREVIHAIVTSEEMLGKRRMEYHQFLTELQLMLEGVGFRENRECSKRGLTVGRMVEARGVRFQAVVLMGLSEGLFPEIEHPDVFLDENLRAALALEQRLKREQAGLFYQAATRSDKYLLITRPYLSDDGEKWEESPFWKAVFRLFDSSVVEKIRVDHPQPLTEAASDQELLFSAVRRRSLPQQYKGYLERWENLRHACKVLKARRSKEACGCYEGFVEALKPALEKRFSPDHVWSTSRLEYYSTCPYQFFVRTVLELEERAIPKLGLDASQLGSMLHEILERTYKSVVDVMNLDEVMHTLENVSNQVFSTAPAVYGFRASPLWEYEKQQLLEKLQKTVCALAEESNWKPIAFEQVFGIRRIPSLVMHLGSELIHMRGVIDRVDQNQDGFIRVVDYKTGSSHLSATDLIDGLRLQLPIYALAARDVLKLGEPVDGIYWKILAAQAGSLKLQKFKTASSQGIEAAFDVVDEHLRRIIRGVRSAEFPPQPPKGGCPSYCPCRQWCWRYEPGW